nr:PREDICTED: protein SOGA1 [Latimeria chalumnae]|eukprot:XP_014342251.1 PREDICTED: protein SOGA1 [Latimeria chalumnae]
MESGPGDQAVQKEPAAGEKKKINRAPSPARPKDVPGWSLKKPRGSGVGAGTALGAKGGLQARVSRRSPGNGLKTEKKASLKVSSPGPGGSKTPGRSAKSSRRSKGSSGGGEEEVGIPSEPCAPAAALCPTDSSSELSDCTSEENKLSLEGLSSDAESGRDAGRRLETPGSESAAGGLPAEDSASPVVDEQSAFSLDSKLQLSASLAFSDLTEELLDGMQDELLREMDELRSENDYLKDEIEELRSEMLEMRDLYMEEDVYQLQDLRQQLDQANKTCRILQYRLRKAERRSLRVAQTGQVDGELIRNLEQDVKVAKDISVRLHNELEAVEKKRIKLEEENEDLREKLIEMDLSKQVLQNEMDKLKENSLKKRGTRVGNKTDKKTSPQEDSADLKCQLHFAKEESALMCKKLSKLAKENDSMKEELVKYRSLYGDLDSSLSIDEVADSPHSREAELKVHLKLVEEEANILSRKIVELEIESRGLRAEMDEMKCQHEREFPSSDVKMVVASGSCGESGESIVELRRHLQFVEEEAELLRRSLIELEDQNKFLMNELNKYKSEHDLDMTMSEDSCSVISEPSQEELVTAKLQISELSGKVKKLQYENRVLLSNLQRCDLASCQSTRPIMETDAEAGDSAQCVPTLLRREGPIGDNFTFDTPSLLRAKDFEVLLAIKDQAGLISKAIDLLISDTNGLMSGPRLCLDISCTEQPMSESSDNTETDSDSRMVDSIVVRLSILKRELSSFIQKVDNLGDSLKEQVESLSTLPDSGSFLSTDSLLGTDLGQMYQPPEFREPDDWELSQNRGAESYLKSADVDQSRETTRDCKLYSSDDNESYSAEIQELQLVLSEAKDSIQGLQEQLSQERHLRREEAEIFTKKMFQQKEEHQKALLRREFELQSLHLQRRLEQKFWSQEKNLLLQESQQFKQNILLLYMKLKRFLRHWKQDMKLNSEGEDFLEVNSMKDLYLLIEEEELNPQQVEKKPAKGENSSENSGPSECGPVLAGLKLILKDLCTDLREESRGMNELQQQFAKAKSAWEIEKTELKCQIAQLESKVGKQVCEKASLDLKSALMREREEHQHLLAESYSAVMDLTKQLQISEKNWNREKLDLLDRFDSEQKQWEQRARDMQNKINQLQKEADPWVLKHSNLEKNSSCWKETLQEILSEKELASETDVKGTNLKRTKSVSSMSEFESLLDSSPYLPGMSCPVNNENVRGKTPSSPSQTLPNSLTDLEEHSKRNSKYANNDKTVTENKAKGILGASSWDCSMVSNAPTRDSTQKQIQRSYTAPDKTGIRIYYSPPVMRRLDGSLVQQNKEKIMVEPGFLFTMAKPEKTEELESSSENKCSRWLCNLSKQKRDLLDGTSVDHTVQSTPGFPSSLPDLEISGNMSDDMKEITNCMRQAIRSSSLERKVKNTSSQTVGVTSVGTQTIQTVSVGLQTESPRASIHTKNWSSRSSSLLSTRSKQISSSLNKVHSRIERPCCSPRYGSPKLQRKTSSKLESSKDRSLWHSSRQNESAWARSTTTRDSPVLSGINDGLSSLFSVVEHTSGSTESIWKPSPQESRTKTETPKYGIVQEFFRNVCGRSQSPTPGTEKPQKDTAVIEDGSKRADLSSLVSQSDNASKPSNKKLLKQNCSEEHKLPTLNQGSKDTNTRESAAALATANEDTACDCTSQSLTSCFARPSRSSARHATSHCQFHSSDPNRIEDKTSSSE